MMSWWMSHHETIFTTCKQKKLRKRLNTTFQQSLCLSNLKQRLLPSLPSKTKQKNRCFFVFFALYSYARTCIIWENYFCQYYFSSKRKRQKHAFTKWELIRRIFFVVGIRTTTFQGAWEDYTFKISSEVKPLKKVFDISFGKKNRQQVMQRGIIS